MDNNKKENKIIVYLLICFISILISLSFLFNEQFEITYEMIILIGFLIILTLSEMFDKLSVPKILILEKNLKKVDNENNELKKINLELVKQITNIKNANNLFAGPVSIVSSSTDVDSINKSDEEIEEEIKPENDCDTKKIESNKVAFKQMADERFKYMRNINAFMFMKALNPNDEFSDIKYDVSLYNSNDRTDGIMTSNFKFDAIKETPNETIFYEIKSRLYNSTMNITHIFTMLSIVKNFNENSNKKAKLVILVPEYDDEMKKIMSYYASSIHLNSEKILLDRFEPAIRNNLLEITRVLITKRELDEYINNQDMLKK